MRVCTITQPVAPITQPVAPRKTYDRLPERARWMMIAGVLGGETLRTSGVGNFTERA